MIQSGQQETADARLDSVPRLYEILEITERLFQGNISRKNKEKRGLTMLTEDQIVNILQRFADSFRDEINKLTIEVDELKQKVGSSRAVAPASQQAETQVVFQQTAAPQLRPVAHAAEGMDHPRTGGFRPGSNEVSIEKFFYSGGK